MKDILIEQFVDKIHMPDNIRVGMMVAEHRKKMALGTATEDFDYAGYAFGQSPFHVPEPIVQAYQENAYRGNYSDPQGIIELREAIAGFNKRHFNLDINPKRIFVGPGTKELIHFIFHIIKGGIIIPSPAWIGYYPLVRMDKKRFYSYHLKPWFDYKINAGVLEEYLHTIQDGQYILVLNNPHNPTGSVYTRQELEDIADVCRRKNTFILSDEIYAKITFEQENFVSMREIYPEGSFITNGISKDRSAGGYRLGYVILPNNSTKELIADFRKVAATVYTNVSTPTQYAGIAAYEENQEIDEFMVTIREIHRIMGRIISREFNEIEGITSTMPDGSFYFLADFNELKPRLKDVGVCTSNDLARVLLEHPYRVALVTGDSIRVKSDDFAARIAFVDYDGKAVFNAYRKKPPVTLKEEKTFVEKNAPKMLVGIESLKQFVDDITRDAKKARHHKERGTLGRAVAP